MRTEGLAVKVSVIFLFLALFTSFASSAYLVNSQDWKDVYSGSYQAYSENETPYFVRSNNLGVMNVLPYGEDIEVIESSDNPLASNLVPRLRSRNYQIGEVTEVGSANLELAPEDSNIVVVPGDYPSAALIAAPYARATDSWVLITNDENLDQVEDLVQEADKSTMIGKFSRDASNQLGDDVDRKIISPQKFNLSVKVAKAYVDKKDASRVVVASGDYISKEAIEGDSPVLVTGRNYLPDVIRDFLFKNPDHSIENAVVIGNRMTSIGMDIREHNITRNGKDTDKKISAFVKYGQARGDSGIYSISLFPLPTGNVSLSIPSVSYNPSSGELFVTYRNTGPSRMYQLTTLRVMENGEVIATVGDGSPTFIGGETSRTIAYDVNITSTEFREANIEFSTAYGTSPESLDTYLTEEGAFSPPLTKNLTVRNISDNSNITLESVTYLKGLDRFRVKVRNPGDSEAYATVRLTNVMVQGDEESFTSEKKAIPSEETEKFYIVADLDRIDLQQNEEVNTVLTYGERNTSLINSKRRNIQLQVSSNSNTTTYALIGASVIIVLLAVLGVARYRGLKLKEYLPSR